MNNYRFIFLLLLLLLILFPGKSYASTIYSNDLKSNLLDFNFYYGSCYPSSNGMSCSGNGGTTGAAGVSKIAYVDAKCVSFDTNNTIGIPQVIISDGVLNERLFASFVSGKNIHVYLIKHSGETHWDTGVTTPENANNLQLCQAINNIYVYIDNKLVWQRNAYFNPFDHVGFYVEKETILTNFKVTDTLPEEEAVVPTPFLDLPFSHQNRSFEQVALNPESWFDHAYPLQNIMCCTFLVRKYTGGLDQKDAYRSHSGYDYARNNSIKMHTPILAAAAGNASFVPESKSGGAGNVIKIDHGNGYQSWYEHLDSNGLVIATESNSVRVEKGQQIGKVGMTGNTNGPHLHFSVLKDVNNNGSFTDDYPYGLVDPLGWEGKEEDPWTLFESNGNKGATSYNLFVEKSGPKKQTITQSTGGTVEMKNSRLSVKPNTLPLDFTMNVKYGPFESDETRSSVVPSLFLTAFTSLGDEIREFVQPIDIEYSYVEADLLNIKEDTLKFYYFNENTGKWEALQSQLDKVNKKVTTQTMHFSQFALMGEIKDQTPPLTTATVKGTSGEKNWYRTDVNVSLIGKDNQSGVGVSETLYKVNDGDWNIYTKPFLLTQEGDYEITYQTIDNAGNKEQQKSIQFAIDKTAPEAQISYDIVTFDLVVSGKDSSNAAKVSTQKQGLNIKYTITDKSGNTLAVHAKELQIGKQATQTIESLQYTNKPLITLDRNIFFTLVATDRQNTIKNLNQYFSVKGEDKILTTYSSAKNSTTVSLKTPRNTFERREVEGIVTLDLSTNNGKIEYTYN